MYISNPEEHVREMKALAAFLIPYTPPKYPNDEDINWFKQRDVTIDGYPVVAHYTQSDQGDSRLDVLTIGCKYSPVVPFVSVCKLAEKFLGSENLTLFEYISNGKKIYSWMALFRDGKAVDNPYNSVGKHHYRGLSFYRAVIDSNKHVTFF